ncbi:hypothetical protein [Alteromonas aestuariivivens]|nr:hypothetical protein [Alteromonas aestuariivivens]
MIDNKPVEMPGGCLHKNCRVTPLALHMVVYQPTVGVKSWWLLKGECSEADYRRVARIIYGLQGLPEQEMFL